MAPAPGFHFAEQGGPTMTPQQVMALARKYGLPARGIMQIAKGESSLRPGVQQHDPGDGMVGYGLLQMTPNAWGKGSAAYRYMQKLGGVRAMADPDKNMQMARFLYKQAGNSFRPWYGTKFLTDRSGEGKLGPVTGGSGGSTPVMPNPDNRHLAFDPGTAQAAQFSLPQRPQRQITAPPLASFAAQAVSSAAPTTQPEAAQTTQAAQTPARFDAGVALEALHRLAPTGGGTATTGGGTTTTGGTTPSTPAAGAAPKGKGVATFDGKPVAAWIKPILDYGRAHGWKGSVASGYRTFAKQQQIYNSGVRPAAKPGTSNHEGTAFPRGAIDVSDPQSLSNILRRSKYASTLVYAGSKDPVHFSHPHGGSY